MDPLKISAIGDKAVTAVQNYIDDCISLKSDIRKNDTIPVFDGDILVYGKNRTISLDNYIGPVRVQVKGSTDSTDFFSIGRKHIEVYENTGGCIFFKVLEEELPSGKYRVQKILYKIINVDVIKGLLQQKKDSIRIDLKELPVDNSVFEEEVSRFVQSIKGEKIDNPAPEEIKALVEEYKEMEKYLDEIEDQDTRFELESQIQTIKSLTNDGTVIWRNKFIYHSRKVLDLAINNLKDHDFAELQFQLGAYLHNQKQYHLVEGYYQMSLEKFRKRDDIANVAKVLNSLASLHDDLNRKEEAELEYQEALKIRRELVESNRNAYIGYVADTLNNLAILHDDLNRKEKAEQEYQEALKIYRELAEANHDAYVGDVAKTLNNLAILYKNLTRYEVAEQAYLEALKIYRELAKINHDAYVGDVAMTLSNFGNLHKKRSRYNVAEREYLEALEIRRELAKTNRNVYIEDVAANLNNLAILHYDMARYKEAEKEYQEALEIRRELAKTNRNVYIGYVAQTLNNLANLHYSLTRYVEAEQEFEEAIEIRRELARKYPDAFIGDLARTLENLAFLLQKDETRYVEARDAANEALGIYKELAKKYPLIWNKYVVKTQRLLDELNVVKK